MKKLILILLALIVFTSTASAVSHVQLMRYDPVPAQAGEYVDVWIKFENKGDRLDGAALKFIEEYPFSLDPNENPEKELGTLEKGQFSIQKFKIRIDKNAIEGDNTITFEYKECAGCIWNKITPSINIIEAHTDFEIVVQEIGKEGTSIAIANIGKNPANSITINIPKQEDIEIKGITSTIIGNLDSGDYTIATYNLKPLHSENNLQIEIHYTDSLGSRQIITKTVPFMSKADFTEIYNKINGIDQKSKINIWFFITLVLLAYIIAKFIKAKRAKKRK